MAKNLGLSIKTKSNQKNTNQHRPSIPVLIDQIIEKSDIILEILDARFIEKTRHYKIEEKAKNLGRTIIYVFNKSDLVDINLIKMNIELQELNPKIFFSCNDRRGIGLLRKIIKIEAKKVKKPSVNIGIIGYPNTGKSSITNILVGKSIAKTSSEAGYTRGIQKVRLFPGIYLIDTPGVIPIDENAIINREDLIKHSQIGVRSWDKIKNPDSMVYELMKSYPNALENHYKIDSNQDSEIFIEQLGRKFNYLRKGNLVDEDKTARKILRDWQQGKIRNLAPNPNRHS